MSSVQSLIRGLALFEALSHMRGRASLAEIAVKADLSTSTTHRLLATLVDAGYVVRDKRNYYVLGNRILNIALAAQGRSAHLRTLARPGLEALALQCGETVNLVTLDGRCTVYIDQVEGGKVLRAAIPIGSSFPAHTSASAKAILAFQHDERLLAGVFPSDNLPRRTSRTITGIDAFKAELDETRARGYAIEEDELEEGVSCLAAPITGSDDVAIAAISIPGPTSRILSPTPERLGSILRKHADQISERYVQARAY